jgi:hypothetical protein
MNHNDKTRVQASSIIALVCRLAQFPPGNRMTLPLRAKKWLLIERKGQQQEDEQRKCKSFRASDKDSAKVIDKDRTNISKVENAVKGEEEVQDDIDHDYGCIHEFLLSTLPTYTTLNKTQTMIIGVQNTLCMQLKE